MLLFSTRFAPHWQELRKRVFWCLSLYIVLLAPLLWQSGPLYALLSRPLISQLPAKTLIATKVLSPFTAPLKLALFTAFILAVPFILWHVWRFVSPALYLKERKAIAPLFTLSTLLFYLGMAFAHHIVIPLTLRFIFMVTPESVTFMPDIASYLDFVLSLYWVFGLTFQVPIVTYALLKANLITLEQIKAKRPYVIVLAFILGMLLTPPDVISQIALAVPMWLLFELGVILFYWQQRPLIFKSKKKPA